MKRSEIVVLTDEEHVLSRSEMYIGSVIPTEEKIPIIENNKIVLKNKTYSVGMHKLLDEAIDNAFDEAKRCAEYNKPMKEIIVKIHTKDNMAEIIDRGMGFYKGLDINKKSGLNNIETALSQLRAGSNFNNDDIETNIIGTNGVGISCTNVLSNFFQVETSDGKYKYTQTWLDFKPQENPITEFGKFSSGTTIKFIPRKTIFKTKWDLELIITKMIFRNKLKSDEDYLNNVKLSLYIDNQLINLDVPFMPNEHLLIKHSKLLNVYVWHSFENSTSISFINGSLCTGIHQKIMQEIINDKIFGYDKSHYFYETFIVLNLPPKNVKFADQNKSKFVSTRNDLEDIVVFDILEKNIEKLQESDWYKLVTYDIENIMKKEEMSKLKRARKNSKMKISDKYFSSQKKENLYLVEGQSALGGLMQRRDPVTDAFYALRGKIKNVRNVSDLASNQEIIDMINILNLNLEDNGTSCKFKRIIIATDSDFDGSHIASLLMNFFNKWFPEVIKQGRLYRLITPLISIENKSKRKYFYSLDEFSKYINPTNIRYLKGLGSNDLKDWEYIFSNLTLERIAQDEYSDKLLTIIFGNNSLLRKKWMMLNK